ncbi:hypothetical protein M9H77_04657 [Catharanthus roseus]|uniref:Uncharacterized protein n=1 Tax=Catharanthus roseus TaxID=4058 RepID=A0ACC0CF60_CATRO|nr:hypothetical protein M9H77_04657 [Catharanthus roseus]
MEDALLPLYNWMDEDVQIPDMEEREEDLADEDVEIQAHMFHLTKGRLTLFAPSHLSRARTSYVPPDLFNSLNTDYIQPLPSTGGMPYAPPPLSAVGLSFDAPLPSGTAGSSVPHIPISCASSSDSNEYGDDPSDDFTPTQQLGFGHRVRIKTTRFTPSDYR